MKLTRQKSKPNWLQITCASVFLAAFSIQANAQATLRSTDGSFEFEGTITDVSEKNFVIETKLGELIIQREFVTCYGDGCPTDVVATERDRNVVLSSGDGSISFEGELISTTETDYVIDSIYGELSIRRELVSCEGAACPSTNEATVQDRIIAVGPSDVGVEVLRSIVQRYADAKSLKVTESAGTDGAIDLFVGNTSGIEVASVAARGLDSADAIRALIEGSASFALVRERVTANMLSEIIGFSVPSVGAVMHETTVALDAMSFVTHPSNPLDSISTDDIKAILTGRINDWSALGGPTGRINIHSLPMDSELMSQLSARMNTPIGGSNGANFMIYDDMNSLRSAVNSDPLGFAVVFRSHQGDLEPMELASSCNIHYGSSDFSVQTREYPFALGWYLYSTVNSDQTDFGQNLMAFMETDEGQDALSSLGLLSQGLRSQAMKEQGNRVLTGVLTNEFGNAGSRVVAEYLGEVAESKRLSTALRFTSGSAQPDRKAQEDIDRISNIIRQPEYANYVVKLVGFSDSIGEFGRNISLSASRAGGIKQLLLAKNPGWLADQNVQILGVGPVAPVECNTTAEGRRLNRRVEVWLAPPRS